MPNRILFALPLFLVTTGCGDAAEPSSGSAGPKSSAAPARSAAEPKSSASPASSAAATKLVHVERSQGECTFAFDVPEELKETSKDGMSFTLESDAFVFTGYAGAALYAEPKHALDMFEDEYDDVYRGKEAGVPLAIVKAKKGPKTPADKHFVTGMATEVPGGIDRPSGCAFSCAGTAAREAEVVAFCKSVKITVAAEKKPQ